MKDFQSRFQSPLGRPLDPRYRSNVLVAVGAVFVGGATGLYNLLASSPLDVGAPTAGIAVFLAWAIARELDPDHSSAALLAMVVAALALPLAPPSLLAAFGILLATRLATGTVGKPIGLVDGVVLIGLGAYLGAGSSTAAVVPALVAGIAISGKRSRLEFGAAAATALAAAASFAVFREGGTDAVIDGIVVLMLVLVGGALAVSLPAKVVQATTDIGDLPIDSWRLGVSRLLVGVTFVVATRIDVSALFATGGAALIAIALDRLLRLGRSDHLDVALTGK